MDMKRLLPKGRMVTLNNTGKIAQVYLEGQEKTHTVHDVEELKVVLKSLNADKVVSVYNLDIHYLLPNQTGGYNSNVFSQRYGY
jgi:hypothetical protein